MARGTILLITFYNKKALGVKFLRKALESAGYSVSVVFFKNFDSKSPESCTPAELDLLKNLIAEIKPNIVGLSVMSSLYLETVLAVNSMIKENFTGPVVWGGVYATLQPEYALKHCDIVMRGESEEAFVELADRIISGSGYQDVQNAAWLNEAGEVTVNDVRPLCTELDKLAFPEINDADTYFINEDKLVAGDPSKYSLTYEISASRGCPFQCSYCSASKLMKMYRGKGGFVRFRSVANVIAELRSAKLNMPRLKIIHFWDEIFSNDEAWVEEFVTQYKKYVNLPFEIWSHPLMVKAPVIKALVKAGLYKVVMGIQSGSPSIRKDIFHRNETQEQIAEACATLCKCKVPQLVYDFMLQHPFESNEQLKETFDMCARSLKPPFELQLHGLYFLPCTDIVDKALDAGMISREQLDKIMFRPIKEHYGEYWGHSGSDPISRYWFTLIKMSQFRLLRPFARALDKKEIKKRHILCARLLSTAVRPLSKIRYIHKKGVLFLEGLLAAKP